MTNIGLLPPDHPKVLALRDRWETFRKTAPSPLRTLTFDILFPHLQRSAAIMKTKSSTQDIAIHLSEAGFQVSAVPQQSSTPQKPTYYNDRLLVNGKVCLVDTFVRTFCPTRSKRLYVRRYIHRQMLTEADFCLFHVAAPTVSPMYYLIPAADCERLLFKVAWDRGSKQIILPVSPPADWRQSNRINEWQRYSYLNLTTVRRILTAS